MKFHYLVFACFALAIMASCNNKPDRPDAILTPEQLQQNGQTQAVPAGGTAMHYTCPNNCVGSGGEGEGTCPVCGTAYVHNQAYHDQGVQSQTQTISPPSAPTEPAQNANGIWHYTCANGCAGGAGGAVACAKCGSTLAHNQAYHQ